MKLVVRAAALRAAIAAVRHAVAKAPIRPILCSVAIDVDEAGVRLVASDGYRLAVAGLAVEPASALVEGCVVIPRAELSFIDRFLGGEATAYIRVEGEDYAGRPSLAFSGTYRRAVVPLLEGTYPSWRVVRQLAEAEPSPRLAAVRSSYLRLPGPDRVVTVRFSTPDRALVIEADEYREYVMPASRPESPGLMVTIAGEAP